MFAAKTNLNRFLNKYDVTDRLLRNWFKMERNE